MKNFQKPTNEEITIPPAMPLLKSRMNHEQGITRPTEFAGKQRQIPKPVRKKIISNDKKCARNDSPPDFIAPCPKALNTIFSSRLESLKTFELAPGLVLEGEEQEL